MTSGTEVVSRSVRVAAILLVAGLMAGPIGTHVYWLMGGTWGLGRSTSSTGIQVVAAVVVLGLVGAVFVVLARVGLWQQTFVSERVIRVLAWGLAAFFMGHGLLSLVEGLAWSLDEWWLYGPSGLVLGLLALIVAGSRGAWPDPAHRALPSH